MRKSLHLLVFVLALALAYASAQSSGSSPSSGNQSTTSQPSQDQTQKPDTQSSQSGASATSSQSGSAATSTTDVQVQIQDALKKDPTLSNASITVSVTDDAVELNGTVASNDDKRAAKKIAKSYAGSRKIKDNLTVSGGGSKTTPPGGMGFFSAGSYRQSQSSQQPQSTQPSGSQSPAAQSPSTSQSPSSEPSSTQTTPVPNGSMNQQTPSSSEQTPSGGQQTPGATAAAGGDIQMQIQNALQKEPTLSNDNINVSVSDDAIELNGTVASGKEKQTAKRIAQSYAGNRKVKDHLTLSGQGSSDNKNPDSNMSTPPSSNSPTTPDPNKPANPPVSSRPPHN